MANRERLGGNEGNVGSSAPKSADKRKQACYFPAGMVEEISAQAARLDRSFSWVVQRAWKTAKNDIAAMPGVDGTETDSE